MSLLAQTPGGSSQFLNGAISGDGIIAGPLAGAANNFAPDGIAGATLIHIRANAAWSLTGLQASGPNVLRWLHNDSDFTGTLENADAGSSAANRFDLGADLAIPAGVTVGLLYNGRTQRWNLFTSALNGAVAPSSAILLGPSATIVTAAGANGVLVPASININRLKLNTAAGAGSATGLTAGTDGQILELLNLIAGGADFTLTNTAGGATQFYGTGDLILPAGGAAHLYYDADVTSWVEG